MIPDEASILDVGGAAGDLEALVRSRGCRSTVIEADPADAIKAAEVCDCVIVGDIETLDLERELAEKRFDVIVFADVLEHLRDPLATLARMTRFMAPDGCVLASVPNVSHAAVRLSLLAGKWEYTPTGLLDRTHLRFFTRSTIERLFAAVGLRIEEMRRIEADAFGTEIPLDRAVCPPGVIEQLELDPDARTYQFVVRGVQADARKETVRGDTVPGVPGTSPGGPGAASGPTVQDLADARRLALERLEVEAAARTLELQRRIWRFEGEVLEYQRRVAEGEQAQAEMALIKSSGSYRLARVLARTWRAVRLRRSRA